jgi:transcriptional regulator with XRE-family HTH domain
MAAETFGDRVRERRIREGLSQEELADKVGISRNYLSQIERGQATNLSWQLMERLASTLGMKVEVELESGTAISPENLPPGLAEFAQDVSLPPNDVRMLAQLQYRGRRPTTAQQWRLLYNIIKAAIESQAPVPEGKE